MAAGEDQAQALVGHRALRFSRDRTVLVFGDATQFVQLFNEAPVTPHPIDRLVTRRAHDPRARVRGHAVARPLRERRSKSVLRRLLRQVEVADQADYGGEDPPELLVVEALYRR